MRSNSALWAQSRPSASNQASPAGSCPSNESSAGDPGSARTSDSSSMAFLVVEAPRPRIKAREAIPLASDRATTPGGPPEARGWSCVALVRNVECLEARRVAVVEALELLAKRHHAVARAL